jgi:hypothetical protein
MSPEHLESLVKGPKPTRSRIAVFGDKNKPQPRPGYIKDLAQILNNAQPDQKKGKKPIAVQLASPTNDDVNKMTTLDPKLINTRTLRPKTLFSEVQQPWAHQNVSSNLHSPAEARKRPKKELELLTINTTSSGQESSQPKKTNFGATEKTLISKDPIPECLPWNPKPRPRPIINELSKSEYLAENSDPKPKIESPSEPQIANPGQAQ